ncbi:hypothetical protein E1B28_010246 [Marasmius oreades]|uniref:Uncharacterized protein n=1 Tax=Marasmius oreades TaxID=181124 RepID=A0A9P7RXE2_9AGAR|nr:uncharacterized protein E1B28_010246 [Marasmius oreades]KAG7091195.1 hypothetical protein E1B28_010246 [Marasmius oreades]
MEPESQATIPCPESLEKIFQRIEEESAQRAQESFLSVPITEDSSSSSNATTQRPAGTPDGQTHRSGKSRRRASISITRFGQMNSNSSSTIQPTSPLPGLASPIYQTHLQTGSSDTLSSGQLSDEDNEDAHVEDDDHVTQVQRIAPRQSIVRSIGNAIPRRLSKARSRPIMTEGDMSSNMVIGVSVQAATVEVDEAPDEEQPSTGAVVHAAGLLKNQKSKSTLNSVGGSGNGRGWIARAKSFTNKLRRRSKPQLTESDMR